MILSILVLNDNFDFASIIDSLQHSIKNKLEEPDENGIYKEAFASSIAKIKESLFIR